MKLSQNLISRLHSESLWSAKPIGHYHRSNNAQSIGSNDLDVWKIFAVAGSIPRDERVPLDFSMSTNVEIRQRRCSCAAAAPVFQKSLRGGPTGSIGQRQTQKDRRIKPPVQISGTGKSRSQFRVDNRVFENRPLLGGRAKLFLRPCQPNRISSRDVQQHVRIKEIHSSPRVSAITFAVVSLGRAAPRANCNQPSTEVGVARFTRSVSSQPIHPPAGSAVFQSRFRFQQCCSCPLF